MSPQCEVHAETGKLELARKTSFKRWFVFHMTDELRREGGGDCRDGVGDSDTFPKLHTSTWRREGRARVLYC